MENPSGKNEKKTFTGIVVDGPMHFVSPGHYSFWFDLRVPKRKTLVTVFVHRWGGVSYWPKVGDRLTLTLTRLHNSTRRYLCDGGCPATLSAPRT